jgi:excisionase family DNA binding protein
MNSSKLKSEKRKAESGAHRSAAPYLITEGQIPAGEQLLDPKGVGKRLKLSPRTVADMANDGRLPAYRLGIYLRFKWVEVEQFITANCKVRAGGGTTGNSAVAARHALPAKGGGQ